MYEVCIIAAYIKSIIFENNWPVWLSKIAFTHCPDQLCDHKNKSCLPSNADFLSKRDFSHRYGW